jgi:DnaJ-like protein
MSEDYYRKLGVPPEATADQIHRAYRALAMRYHPDRNRLPEAPALMAAINEAYEILGKPAKRAAYDRTHSKRDESLDDAVLCAARNTLVKQMWTVVTDRRDEIVLKNGSRLANIGMVPVIDTAIVNRFHSRARGFCVVLGLRVTPPLRLPSQAVAVVDLMHSRLYAGDFPDATYRSLFQSFL